MPAANARASCPRPYGLFLRALTAAEGDPGGAKKRTSCPQKRTPRCARYEDSSFRRRPESSFAQLRLLILGPVWDGEGRTEEARANARVSARDRAHSAAGQDVLSAEPRPPVANRRSRRPTRAALSLGYFSLGKQREVTRSRDASGKHRDVSRSSRSAADHSNGTWIPAFAGMTSGSGFRPSPE